MEEKIKQDDMCNPITARQILDEPVRGIKIWCVDCGNQQTYYMSEYDDIEPAKIEPVYCEKCKSERRFKTIYDV